jgi:hypothetical protein
VVTSELNGKKRFRMTLITKAAKVIVRNPKDELWKLLQSFLLCGIAQGKAG